MHDGLPFASLATASPSITGATMKHHVALWQPLMNVVWPHTRKLPSGCFTAREGCEPGPPPPHMITRGLSR